jgi:hypothetical protein
MAGAKPTWLRRDGESAAAYEAFCLYRDEKPTKRTQRGVASRLGKSIHLISQWAVRDEWVARCIDFDTHRDDEYNVIETALATKTAQRHVDQAQRLQTIAMNELERLVALSAKVDIPLIDAKTATHMIVEGFKMERLATGASTEKTENVMITQPMSAREIAEHNRFISTRLVEETTHTDEDETDDGC